MTRSPIVFAALLSCSLAMAQAATAGPASLPPQNGTLPIVFSTTLSAARARVGDSVQARTTQISRLGNGEVVPAGTRIVGHVTAATPFAYDGTPYATQQQSTLAIHFDSMQLAGQSVPLNVKVRAMAAPIESWAAREARSTDLDPDGTVTQIGGDKLTPSQSEVVDRNGDVVAYNRHDGVYARLIAQAGCDASINEVSVGMYSASACGLYGFGDVATHETGSSTLALVSTHTSPRIWRNSTALLEILPQTAR